MGKRKKSPPDILKPAKLLGWLSGVWEAAAAGAALGWGLVGLSREHAGGHPRFGDRRLSSSGALAHTELTSEELQHRSLFFLSEAPYATQLGTAPKLEMETPCVG